MAGQAPKKIEKNATHRAKTTAPILKRLHWPPPIFGYYSFLNHVFVQLLVMDIATSSKNVDVDTTTVGNPKVTKTDSVLIRAFPQKYDERTRKVYERAQQNRKGKSIFMKVIKPTQCTFFVNPKWPKSAIDLALVSGTSSFVTLSSNGLHKCLGKKNGAWECRDYWDIRQISGNTSLNWHGQHVCLF